MISISLERLQKNLLKQAFILMAILFALPTQSASLLISMDADQQNHLKAYGIAYWSLQQDVSIHWLLNYQGGSFLMPYSELAQTECTTRGVSFKVLPDVKIQVILDEIAQDEVNMDVIKLEKPPTIAVYSPKGKKPWDDAVTLALNYAEIPYDVVYDKEIIEGSLSEYEWLHLHHEDFTGQYGKFYGAYRYMQWYKDEVNTNEEMAAQLGFKKVSQLKKAVALEIKNFVARGGFLFAMCSATDTYDIAMAAENIDICEGMFDGDAADPKMQEKLDYSKTFAFQDFTIEKNPLVYEYSDIDVTTSRKIKPDEDYFTLFEFSAKWDPVPTMLCQNHRNMIKGFMGQTTAFNKKLIKPNVLIMGENKAAGEARYIHGEFGKGTWTFYSGHDPEDYQHLVGDPPTDLDLHKNSAGYRLILNNVLFPAAKKKKRKT